MMYDDAEALMYFVNKVKKALKITAIIICLLRLLGITLSGVF